MGTLVIDDKDKIGKEELLLGEVVVQSQDCNGNVITLTGLTANDLVVKNTGGKNLVEYIASQSGLEAQVASTAITLTSDATKKITIQQVVDGLNDVHFEIVDLQAKYNTLKG